MIAIVVLGLLACASAVPRYHHHHHHHHHHSHYEDDCNMDEYLNGFIESEMFDTRRFWSELNSKMLRLDAMLADLSKRYPNNKTTVQIDDKEYKITLQLHGFVEKEIIVKAKKGLLVVQAVRKVVNEPDRDYLEVITLPDNVGENGTWTYQNGLLKIAFPITQVDKEILTPTTTPDVSSEEIGNNEQVEDQNEDTEKVRGDVDYTQTDFKINEIPYQKNTVEATTYAVGLKDDVELLPMSRYYSRKIY